MARIVAALEPHDHVRLLGQPIDDLALALVAPLGAHDNHVRHRSQASHEQTPAQGQGWGKTLQILMVDHASEVKVEWALSLASYSFRRISGRVFPAPAREVSRAPERSFGMQAAAAPERPVHEGFGSPQPSS